MHTEQEIMERLRQLPPQQLDEVIRFIDSIVGRPQGKVDASIDDDMRRSILKLRGRGKGEQLIKRLLQSRREDRALDKQI